MGRLAGLDALRGFAALLVFAHHSQVILRLPVAHFAAGSAVDLFFMLSGFVLARTYEADLRDGLRTVPFIKKRYRRLWPPMAIGAVLGLIQFTATAGFRLDYVLSFFALLAFLPSPWMPGKYFDLNVPAYTLFIEICLNLLHAIAFAKMRDRWLVVLVVVGVAAYLTALLLHIRVIASAPIEMLPTLFRGVGTYAAGILIYRWYGDRPIGDARIAICAFPVLTIAAANLLSPTLVAMGFLCVSPFLIRASLGLGKSPTAAWLGALSFPLYAVHQPVLQLMRSAPPELGILAAVLGGILVMWITKLPLRNWVLRSPLNATKSG